MTQHFQQTTIKKIGVLNLQGAVSEHITMLNKLDNVEAVAIKQPQQLDILDGLIIPGGESTAISRLINQNALFEPIRKFAQLGKGIFGTCAGLILCGMKTSHDEVELLKLIDITVERNGFGRQINSFETVLNVTNIDQKIPAVFIRAPYIANVGKHVKQLAFIDSHCVMAQQDNILVCSFHPELTKNNQIMRYFVAMC